MSLILHPTSIAQWYSLVNEAEDHCGNKLNSDLESYLVLTLQRYTNKPELAASILAIEYLQSLGVSGKLRDEKLREVGDKCLLFSGFFPEWAHKRLVTVSYFVELGKHAYHDLALLKQNHLTETDLFATLRDYFVSLLDLLFSMRELNGQVNALSLIQAEELWRNTGSRYALSILKRHNKDIILAGKDIDHMH